MPSDMSLIEPGLWVGSMGGGELKPPAGVNFLVSLTRTVPYFFTTLTPPEFRGLLWFPLEPNCLPELPWLKTVVHALTALRSNNYSTFVYCASGINRSPFVVAAYLMSAYGCDCHEALEKVSKARPATDLDSVFLRILSDYQLNLRNF